MFIAKNMWGERFRLLLAALFSGFWLLLAACCLPPEGRAESEKPPFVVETAYAADAAGRLAVLWITPESGYCTYAPGGGNLRPVRVDLSDSDGAPLAAFDAEVLYLPGVERKDPFEPDKRVPVYEGRFPIFIRLGPDAPETFTARISLLLCSSTRCTPAEQAVRLRVPAFPEAPDTETAQVLAEAGPMLPAETAPLKKPEELSPPVPDPGTGKTAGLRSNLAGTRNTRSDATPIPSLPAFSPRYVQSGFEPASIGLALLLGAAAGLILNIMPCVLPVLTIKITALLAAGEGGRARFREHNLLFAAGILTWFVLLALFAGGAGLAWGGLFQEPAVIYGLLVLVFLLGLSLFDVFTLPVLDLKIGRGGSSRTDAWLSGLAATLLATPCSGPLLGGVLGWAAVQPWHVQILIFCSTGLGMALPWLALAAWPDAARLLPRPGAWTGVAERLAGFFLMGTALYLLSILPERLRLPALVTLLICAVGAWLWGLRPTLASPRLRLLAGVLALLLPLAAAGRHLMPEPSAVAWQDFTLQRMAATLGRKPILLEFTADWCPTCKVLERTVLTPERLDGLQRRYGPVLLRADLTRPDPAAEALLRDLGSVSIPLLALFPAGPDAASPLVLRDAYTAAQLEAAAKELFHKEAPHAAQP